LALAIRALGSWGWAAGEGAARARVAKGMEVKRASLTRENMATKAKQKEWERVKAWERAKWTEVFYSVFLQRDYSSTIICWRIGCHEGRIKAGQEVDWACPEQASSMRDLDMVA
jgi:hypothetical protein